MKKTKFISLFLSFVILLTLAAPMSALAADDPDIQAKSAILVELNSGKTLYAKNEHDRLDIASVTKVMTVLLAVLACEERDNLADRVVVAPSGIAFDLTEDSSTQNIQPGEEMRFIDLMYCALVSSANEACNAIAYYVGGSVSRFVDMMNAKAEELGCEDTHFMNTHGLTARGHYSSAWDLYLIMNEATKHSLFTRIAGTQQYTVPPTNMSDARDLENTNRLLFRDSDYFCEYCTGGKTGSTDAAGYCLTATAESEDQSLIAVVLGADAVEVPRYDEDEEDEYYDDEEDYDVDYVIQSFSETKRLIEWGVENFGWQNAVSEGDELAVAHVSHGDGADRIKLFSSGTIRIFTENTVKPSDYNIVTRLYSNDDSGGFLAPINSGDVMGEATVYLNGELCGTVRLLAKNSVRMMRTEYIRTRIRETLQQKWLRRAIAIAAVLIFIYIVVVLIVWIRKLKRRFVAKARRRQLRMARKAEGPVRQTTISREELNHILSQYGAVPEEDSYPAADIVPAEQTSGPEDLPVEDPVESFFDNYESPAPDAPEEPVIPENRDPD